MRCGADLEVAGQEGHIWRVLLKSVIGAGLYRKRNGPGRTYTFKPQIYGQTVGPLGYINSRLSLVLVAAQQKERRQLFRIEFFEV